jgi:hypothetical protein
MLVGADGSARDALAVQPELDRKATLDLAARMFPKERLEPLGDGDLRNTRPPGDVIHAGCFSGVSVVAAKEFAIDYPSRLETHFLKEMGTRTVYLRAMHSVVAWFAFAVWHEGKLQRSLSLSPESGVLEDIGARLSFEMPYWSGDYPVVDPDDEKETYSLIFHPLELGEAALKELFGYQLEGVADDALLEPHSIPLIRLKRRRARFRFW